MKILVFTTFLLIALVGANQIVSAPDAKNKTDDQDDWKAFRQFNDFVHYTWAGFIKGWYRKSHTPTRVDEKCFGPWIDQDLMLMYKVTNQYLEFDFMNLNYEECMKAAVASVDIFFKNDEYCHFRKFIVDAEAYCGKEGTDCDVDKALLNLQKNALNIISKLMQVSELFQKADELTTPEEIEETCTTLLKLAVLELILFKRASIEVVRYFIARIMDYIQLRIRVLRLKKKMSEAKTYEEWRDYAKTLDILEDKEKWKNNKISRLYDYESIELRYLKLKQMRKRKDIQGIVDCLRSDLVKNLGGYANPELYCQCYFGTKKLIEKYHNEIIKDMRFIFYYKGQKLPLTNKIEFFAETRHSYGRTALLLSGGATFGRFHMGVIKALYEQDLMPRIVAGSSVGSIIAAIICSKSIEELPDLLIPENSLKRQFLFYKANTIWGILIRFLKGQDILDGQALIKAVREFCGDLTFKEIHDNYKWNLNITVTDHINATNSRLLNYLTSPNVIIWSAAAASSAIPYIFEAQELMVKTINGDIVPYRPTNRETRYLDGSIGGDLPMQRMSELFNVNTFIVSQVNPHVIPFITIDGGGILDSNIRNKFTKTVKALIGNEIKHWINQLSALGLMPTVFQRITHLMTQQYKGHITIVPNVKFKNYINILRNPNMEDLNESVISSYCSTFSKISLIRAIFGVEREFDRYYVRLKDILKGRYPQHYEGGKERIQRISSKHFPHEQIWEDQIQQNDQRKLSGNKKEQRMSNHNLLYRERSQNNLNNGLYGGMPINFNKQRRGSLFGDVQIKANRDSSGNDLEVQHQKEIDMKQKLYYYYGTQGLTQKIRGEKGSFRKIESKASILSQFSQEFFGSEDEEIQSNSSSQEVDIEGEGNQNQEDDMNFSSAPGFESNEWYLQEEVKESSEDQSKQVRAGSSNEERIREVGENIQTSGLQQNKIQKQKTKKVKNGIKAVNPPQPDQQRPTGIKKNYSLFLLSRDID